MAHLRRKETYAQNAHRRSRLRVGINGSLRSDGSHGDAHGEEAGASEYFVTLSEPRHVDVTGDSAYVVVSATMTFKVKGQEVRQSDATFAVALRNLEQGWRITAWAWAKGIRG